ncbi:ABC transporter substrate-binding protein [Actinopolymorpha alba]|uniref:ABC transporter substrate-binding protein n=1 Tax=Actinopolymorpha alba TaxID=533267 RepID=UPI00035DD58F|nr:extracellular solute-binding protein [Actinopolymorpha alba]
MSDRPLSRRALLRGLGAGAALGAAASVSSCSLVGSPRPASKESSGKVRLTIAIVPDPSGASEFYRRQFDRFTQKTGITVNVVENPTEQQLNAVELMFQQNNPPDVFRCQGPDALDRFSSRGWTAALDEYATSSGIPARFPEDALLPRTSGLHRNGKLMSLPLVSGQWSSGGFLVYNKGLLAKGGFTRPPETSEEYEAYARTITAKGGGKFFGAALSSARPSDVNALQAQAGPYSIGSGIDLRTGKVAFSDSSLVDQVELIRRMQSAKIFQPGWESWDGARVFTEFAKERVAFYIGGGWHVNEIKKLNPSLDFGVATVPIPASGRGSYYGQGSAFAPLWSMSAKTKHPDEAWKLMDFLVSEEFQKAYFDMFRTFTAMEGTWREARDLSGPEKGIIAAFDASIRRAPSPSTDGGPGVQRLMADKSAKPDLAHGDSSLLAITRNRDFAPMAKELDVKLDAFLEQDIAKISATELKVSRADLTYSDWDPLQNWKPAA